MLTATGKALKPYPGFSQISAFRQGWVGLFPLRDRTAVVAVYDSREISDQEMLDRLPIVAGLPIRGDCVVSGLNPAIHKRAWIGNCVAVGESAFALEPLDSVQLHIAHNCISQLMALFPAEPNHFPEAQIYNQIIRRVATNLRDFQASHYKLNRRFDEPLWDRCRDVPAPQTLERKLEVFSARGRVPLNDDEGFEEEGWESLFIGHGLIPESYDPRVDAIPEEELIALVHKRLHTVAEQTVAMPAIDDFLTGARAEEPAEAALGG
jgi:tryptophan halogenase